MAIWFFWVFLFLHDEFSNKIQPVQMKQTDTFKSVTLSMKAMKASVSDVHVRGCARQLTHGDRDKHPFGSAL